MIPYTNVDYAGLVSDTSSSVDYYIFFVKVLITCKSKKQSVIFQLSAEAKFRIITQKNCELLKVK